MHNGKENMAARRSTHAKLQRLRRWFGKNKHDLAFLCPGLSGVQFTCQNGQIWLEYVSFYVAFFSGGTRCPYHDSELTLCYHDVFLTWGHNHNDIVLFYHDSPITWSHFMDPTDRAIKGFYYIMMLFLSKTDNEIWHLDHIIHIIIKFFSNKWAGRGCHTPHGVSGQVYKQIC